MVMAAAVETTRGYGTGVRAVTGTGARKEAERVGKRSRG